MSIETVGQTEEMRHVPRLELLIEKLDRDVRWRIETLHSSCFESSRPVDSALTSELETRFRQLGRWLERMGEQARGRRFHTNHDFNLRSRVRSALAFAIESLSGVDATQFRHRVPFHHFERSRGEYVYASFLMVNGELDRITELARKIDPDLAGPAAPDITPGELVAADQGAGDITP